MSEDLSQFQQEWRAIVLSKLNSLETGMAKLSSEIVDMKIKTSEIEEIKSLKDKVEKLEAFKYKALGVITAANVLVASIAWVVTEILRK